MSSYLLLRNNKQSGPFSKEQLLQLGIKPYDLVWLEGRSAAWRYPGELPELKDHAPIVEEQPYDRFYKKPSEEPIKPAPEIINVKKLSEISEEVKYEAYAPKKTVSIVMPKQVEPPIESEEEPVLIKATASFSTVPQRKVEVETKYSQPLDEIKDMYVKQLQLRKHKTAQKKFIIQTLKKAAVFVAIIGCGILIGFALKSKKSVQNNAVNIPVQNVSPVTTETSLKEESIPVNGNNIDSAATSEINEQLVNNRMEDANIKSGLDHTIVPDKKSGIVEKKKMNEEKNESSGNQQSSSTIINTASNDRIKNSREGNAGNEVIEKSIAATPDLSKLVSVKSNSYKLKAFGGFQNLELTVSNDSKFILDNVMVELQYLKMNDQPAKIDHIRFQSIAPGGSLTIRIPDNNRGAKLIYKIIKIEPKDINITTAGL